MKTISTGHLGLTDGGKVAYEISHGWDLKTSLACDTQWGQDLVALLTQISAMGLDEKRLKEVIASISMEDSHWQWTSKSIDYNGSEYEWFFLKAEGLPQAAAVIYHPEASKLSPGNIFYIEFLAVAPWNRDCAVRKRRLQRVGTTLLTAVQRVAIDELKLRPGFSLHSLNGAERFYKRIGMTPLPEHTEDKMLFFELSEAGAAELLNAQ